MNRCPPQLLYGVGAVAVCRLKNLRRDLGYSAFGVDVTLQYVSVVL